MLPPAAIRRSASVPTLLAILLTTAFGSGAGAAYRCESPGEPPRFSQFPCGEGVRLDLRPAQAVEVPPLSAAERERLEAFEATRRRQQADRARARRQAATAEANRRRAHADRCSDARADLDALERRRRKGYTLSESRSLDRREAALVEAIERYC